MGKRRYITFNYPNAGTNSETLLTGIRSDKNNKKKVYISGFYKFSINDRKLADSCGAEIYKLDGNITSFVYHGKLSKSNSTHKAKGKFYNLSYPSSSSLGRTVTATSLYGPNNFVCRGNNNIQVVGNYITLEAGSTSPIGCLYEGKLDGSGKWVTIIPPGSINTIVHSTMGGLAVGNYISSGEVFSKAFIYNIKTEEYIDINLGFSVKSLTAYGIWLNSPKDNCCPYRYTIAGGFSRINSLPGTGEGYIIDWNNKTKTFSNFASFIYTPSSGDNSKTLITHFNGITSNGCGGYNLTGDQVSLGSVDELGFYARIKNGKVKWEDIHYPGSVITSGNSVDKKNVIGVYKNSGSDQVNGYISYVK